MIYCRYIGLQWTVILFYCFDSVYMHYYAHSHNGCYCQTAACLKTMLLSLQHAFENESCAAIIAIISTHWSRNEMDAISQTTFWSAFSWMKMFEFRIRFHWSLFLRVQLMIIQHWFRWWLGAVQATSHYLNQWWLDYRRIYASLGLNELINAFWIPLYYRYIFIDALHINALCLLTSYGDTDLGQHWLR